MAFTRKFNITTVILYLFVFCLIASVNVFSAQKVPSQFIVKLGEEKPLDMFLDEYDCILVDSINNRNTYLVYTDDSAAMNDIINSGEYGYGVEFIQPNYRLDIIPEIDQISQSFPDELRPVYVANTSPVTYFEQCDVYLMELAETHEISTGEGVTVAVIDNGIEFDHPLFNDTTVAIPGYDYIDFDEDPSEEVGDAYGHGTFVSGIVRLVAPDAKLMAIRAFDEDGFGNTFAVILAIYYAVNNGADVINMSFSLDERDRSIDEAVREANRNGLIMVAATGNEGENTMTYPAAYPYVFAVSAIDTLEYRADFSNYGPYVDICAPGVNVYSSLAGEYEWGSWNGTSFAAPFVSAAGALIKSKYPSIVNNNIYKILRKSARGQLEWGDIGNFDMEYGYGCLDMLNALNSVVLEGDGWINMQQSKIDIIKEIISTVYIGDSQNENLDQYDVNNSGTVNIIDIIELIKQNDQ